MAEDGNPVPAKIPPKLVIRPENGSAPAPVAGSASAEPPKTIRLQSDSAVPTGGLSKKETTKIPLADTAAPAPSSEPRTIRLRADASRPPAMAPAPAGQSPATPDGGAEKRRTAKISLEAALGPSPVDAPRTIRLKKPSEAGTVRVGDSSKPKRDTAPITAAEPAAASAEPADTRKKTIKIRRPGAAPGVVVVEEGGTEVEVAGVGGVDRPHWVFLVSSIAATLVTCVLTYCLTAQVCGPNSSLTQLSYGAPSLNLPWPGKILGPNQ